MEHKDPAFFVSDVYEVPVAAFSIHDHSAGLGAFEFKSHIIMTAVVSRCVVVNSDIGQAGAAHAVGYEK